MLAQSAMSCNFYQNYMLAEMDGTGRNFTLSKIKMFPRSVLFPYLNSLIVKTCHIANTEWLKKFTINSISSSHALNSSCQKFCGNNKESHCTAKLLVPVLVLRK